ncbi:MAG: class I SAM-dependent methyltransferase [Patescibacteria group bacterium]
MSKIKTITSIWEKIYDKEGESYKYYDILETPHPDLEQVIKEFKKSKAKKVLDLGCGAGRNALYLAQNGFTVYGIDNAPTGLKILRKKLKERGLVADLKLEDVYKPLPYKDDFFDALISIQVIQHAKEATILKAIKEITRIVKPGGIIFITVCGRYSKGKVRLFLVKTAKKIAQNTYLPTQGNETGLIHFIYNKDLIKKHFSNFKILKLWRDNKDYFAFIASNNK